MKKLCIFAAHKNTVSASLPLEQYSYTKPDEWLFNGTWSIVFYRSYSVAKQIQVLAKWVGCEVNHSRSLDILICIAKDSPIGKIMIGIRTLKSQSFILTCRSYTFSRHHLPGVATRALDWAGAAPLSHILCSAVFCI